MQKWANEVVQQEEERRKETLRLLLKSVEDELGRPLSMMDRTGLEISFGRILWGRR